MNDYTTPAPSYTQPGDSTVNRVQPFQLIGVQKVRQGGNGSTPAWELTFKVPSLLQQGPAEKEALEKKQIAPGMQVALLPVNNKARVERLLHGLKEAPLTHSRPGHDGRLAKTDARIPVTLPGRDGVAYEPGLLTVREALAHTVDLTRPTEQLKKLAKVNPKDTQYDIPVEEFINLPGIRGRISFAELVANQPPLENRKYTPSGVDVKKGEIRLLVSELHKNVTLPDGKTVDSRGTNMGMLTDLAEQFSKDHKPVNVNGFLDLRKHKLPYHKAGDKPRILISTGVGIAPHLAYLRDCAANGRDNHVALMLSGDRLEKDHILDAEIESYFPQDVFHHVHSKPTQGVGSYVGEALLEHADRVWETLQQGGVIYLCGNEGMREGKKHLRDEVSEDGKGINQALLTIARIKGGLKGADAKQWLNGLYGKVEGMPKQIEESMSFDDRFYKEKWPKQVAANEAKGPVKS